MVGQGMEAPGSTRGPKADLSQRSQQMRVLVGLQEQGRKIFAQSCEEKLRQNRELLPSLKAALQEDSSVLDFVLKYNKLPIKDAFGEGQELVSATESLEVVIKKIEAKVHDQVKVCDMLLHQLKQWSQARDERQRHLQDLQDAETDPKWQEPQLQTIRQLGNDIEKMLMKIHSGEIVTNLYLRLQEVLRRELVYLPQYLDLLSGMTVMYHEELTPRTSLKANDVIKKLMAEAGPQVRVEKQLRDQSLAEQRKHIESLRHQEESEKQQRQQAVSMLSAEQDQSSSEALVGADVEAAMAKMQREAFVTDKMEKAKTALQCSCLWDIPSSIQAQRKSLGNLQQHINECNETKNVLKKTLEELESKQAKLKFNQPVSTTRCCWPLTVVPARPPPLGGTCPNRHPDLHPTAATHSSRTGRVSELPALLLAEHPKLPLGSRSSLSPCLVWEVLPAAWSWPVVGDGAEELRENLKQEEARLEQMRAQMLKNQKRLIEFGNIIDNMFLRLQGIPGQDSGAVVGLEQKLQHCEQKLQSLKEKVAARPEDSTDENSETFAKVRNLLEKRIADETQNLRISFEDEDAMEDDTLDFEDEDHDYIPSREDIKKQGLQLIRMNTRRRKKK
ncbi:coiled-coil domain-containing protein 183 [Pyrgilauda ruficollis]|uniref:coiled-coil domain-containing protein 183 n=1 Tax=Pyrgilauda ruficollis TaxID=221976 RepID=UPI001B86A867|nr:coiled-coil domain-containing protein 183 [Pyrgilauda ruficollis]